MVKSPRQEVLPMSKISRRPFVEGTGARLAAATVVPLKGQQPATPEHATLAPAVVPRTPIGFTINGIQRSIEVKGRWTLVELLRDPLQAFIDHDGSSMRFLYFRAVDERESPGSHNLHPAPEEVRAGMTGNICRCSNYNHYVEAVLGATAKSATTEGAVASA
jgi:hypothetical protein